MSRCQIYLVPGFFGFTSLADLTYFSRVDEVLGAALAARGVDAEIHSLTTQPTGSIRRRAERVLDQIIERGGLEADDLHFVGHSTGGLDVRLLLTPGVRLRPDSSEERIGARARSCVTVSTPHYGTPLASFFTTLPGRRVLEALTVLASTGGGRYALWSAARALRWIARADDILGRRDTFLDAWARRALSRVSLEREHEIWEFFRDIASDQGAIIQLTPETLNLFNAAVVDRPACRYGSVVTAAPPPPLRYSAAGFLSPSTAALRVVFTALYAMASREHRHYPYPHPGGDVLDAHRADVPFEITRRSNDGIVPALSQIYGQVLAVVCADHLDVVGQYDTGEPHADWLPSSSSFTDERFTGTWDRIADFIGGRDR